MPLFQHAERKRVSQGQTSPAAASPLQPGEPAAAVAQEAPILKPPPVIELLARSQSTPDVSVLAFESRTERLLNQHRRLEVRNLRLHPQLQADADFCGSCTSS